MFHDLKSLFKTTGNNASTKVATTMAAVTAAAPSLATIIMVITNFFTHTYEVFVCSRPSIRGQCTHANGNTPSRLRASVHGYQLKLINMGQKVFY